MSFSHHFATVVWRPSTITKNLLKPLRLPKLIRNVPRMIILQNYIRWHHPSSNQDGKKIKFQTHLPWNHIVKRFFLNQYITKRQKLFLWLIIVNSITCLTGGFIKLQSYQYFDHLYKNSSGVSRGLFPKLFPTPALKSRFPPNFK